MKEPMKASECDDKGPYQCACREMPCSRKSAYLRGGVRRRSSLWRGMQGLTNGLDSALVSMETIGFS